MAAHQAAVEPFAAVVADEHAHRQPRQHKDVAVFADRRPAGQCACHADGEVEEEVDLEIMLVQPQNAQTRAQPDDRAEHTFHRLGVIALETGACRGTRRRSRLSIRRVGGGATGRECGGEQDDPAEPHGVARAAVAVAFVGAEPAADEAVALRGVHIGCRLKRKCEKHRLPEEERVCAVLVPEKGIEPRPSRYECAALPTELH